MIDIPKTETIEFIFIDGTTRTIDNVKNVKVDADGIYVDFEKNGVPGFIAVPKNRVMLVKTTKVII